MLNDRVIRTTFIISLAGHLLFLGIPLRLRPNCRIEEKSKDLELVYIEIEKPLLLPKIDMMGQEKKIKEIIEKPQSKTEISQSEIAKKEKSKVEEQIKILNPADEAMLRYQDMIKQEIEEVRRYPFQAKRQGIEGATHATFVVLSNGISQNIKIVRSSGFKILDDEAIATIKRANPFPPIPKGINNSWVQIKVSIVFTLK